MTSESRGQADVLDTDKDARVPPLPHPSWRHDHIERTDTEAERLSAEDFWKRLGL